MLRFALPHFTPIIFCIVFCVLFFSCFEFLLFLLLSFFLFHWIISMGLCNKVAPFSMHLKNSCIYFFFFYVAVTLHYMRIFHSLSVFLHPNGHLTWWTLVMHASPMDSSSRVWTNTIWFSRNWWLGFYTDIRYFFFFLLLSCGFQYSVISFAPMDVIKLLFSELKIRVSIDYSSESHRKQKYCFYCKHNGNAWKSQNLNK